MYNFYYQNQWRIQDLQQEGGASLVWGADSRHCYVSKIFCQNERIGTLRGRAPGMLAWIRQLEHSAIRTPPKWVQL